MNELKSQFDTEHTFSQLYKTQVDEMMQEFKDKLNDNKRLEQENAKLQTLTENLNSSLAHNEKQISNLEAMYAEKEKQLSVANKNLELLEAFRARDGELSNHIETLKKDKEDDANTISTLVSDLEKLKLVDHSKELETLTRQLQQEKLLKETAVNKLAEIMNRRDINLSGKNKKGNAVELKKKEKECRRLQQELTQERELFNDKITKAGKEFQDLNVMYSDETNTRLRLQMELDSKDAEIEQLRQKLTAFSHDDSFMKSMPSTTSIENVSLNSTQAAALLFSKEMERIEGWLSIPNKQNIRRHGWRKQYVVVSSRKIIFYNSENDKVKADPALILDLK